MPWGKYSANNELPSLLEGTHLQSRHIGRIPVRRQSVLGPFTPIDTSRSAKYNV